MILSRTIAIGLSILLRAGLMLTVSALVYALAPPEEAAVFFQILLLQSIVIAFLSAAGFFRVQSVEPSAVADYLAAMLVLLPLSALLPAGLILLASEYQSHVLELAIVWAGAIATAMAAPLAGLVLRARGPFAAFLPSCIGALATGAGVGVWYALDGSWDPLMPYAVLAGFQCLTFVLLAARAPEALGGAVRRLNPGGAREILRHARETLGVGTANVMHYSVLLAVREIWAGKVDAELAAAVFLVLRFSEAGFQLGHMVLSGHALPERLIGARHALALQAVMFACAAGAVLIVGGHATGLHPLVMALVMQVAADCARLPWSLGFLWQMLRFRLGRYLVFTLVPPVLGAAVAALAMQDAQPGAVILMMLAVTWSGAAISSLQSRGDPSGRNNTLA